jgi:hypothetical protein
MWVLQLSTQEKELSVNPSGSVRNYVVWKDLSKAFQMQWACVRILHPRVRDGISADTRSAGVPS